VSLSAQLRIARRDFPVVVELEVAAETLVVVGPSGCGKTSLLRSLAGLLAPDEGHISLDGRVLQDTERGVALPPEDRHVGVVFQSYALFPHLDVAHNVAYGLTGTARDDRDRRVAAALDRVRLTLLATSRPAELSGGEQQRVAVARALVTEPRLLLLDEPLSALDINTRTNVRHELAELLRELAIPTLVVSHDLRDAEVLADRIAVMDRGRIVQIGTPAEVTANPVNEFIAQFSGTNLIPAALLDPQAATGSMRAVNPAKIRLRRAPADDDQPGWATTVAAIVGRGSTVRITLTTPRDAYADLSTADAAALGLAAGDPVIARVDPIDARDLLPAATAHTPHPDPTPPTRPPRQGRAARLRRRGAPGSQTLNRIVAAALSVITVLVVISATRPAPTDTGPAAGGQNGMLTAFVAANATDAFNQIIDRFQREHPGTTVRPSYAGTQILYTQMEQGAAVDLFLSADESHARQAVDSGLIPRYFPVSRSNEIIVVPKTNPAGITSLQDLGTRPVKLIIGVPEVPIGIYTRQILTGANAVYGPGFSDRALSQVVSTETDVKQVLNKVALNEADAGIVYRTDVTPKVADKVQVIDIPPTLQVIATNYISVPTRAPNPTLAQQLLDYLLSPPGQDNFTRLGYLPLTTTDPTPTAPPPTPTPGG